jgi:uncharacterized membrane protein YuzA (DUF378 family)
MGTVRQLRDMLEFIFGVRSIIIIILYMVIDFSAIPPNNLAFVSLQPAIASKEGRAIYNTVPIGGRWVM